MKIRLRLVLCVILMVGMQACSSLSVSQKSREGFDLTAFTTFGWLEKTPASANDLRVQSETVRNAVVAAVENELTSKGYRHATDPGKADFLLAWHGAVDKKLQQQSIDHFYGPYGYGPAAKSVTSRQGGLAGGGRTYEEGTLVIDILDPQNHRVVWRGIGKQELADVPASQSNHPRIRQAIAEIMTPLPTK